MSGKDLALRTLVGGLLSLVMLLPSPWAKSGEAATQVFQEVRVQKLVRDPRTAQPVVVLADPGGKRGLLIWIGESEARALEDALQGVTHRRPLTHDLLGAVIEKLQARIDQVRVTALRDDVFYASVLLTSPRGQAEMDARPSDAMVLAVRCRCPIAVEASLFRTRSFALPADSLQQYGVELQDLTGELAAVLGYRGEGVLVSQVEPQGLADKSGLQREDILVEVGGKPLTRATDLEEALPAPRTGLDIKVYRKGEVLSLTLPPPLSD
jgi:bifunctional DNase/RNase